MENNKLPGTKLKTAMIMQAARKTKTFRLSLGDETLSRLERLEDSTRCPADTWIELATDALLDTFEHQGFLALPLSVVAGATPPLSVVPSRKAA